VAEGSAYLKARPKVRTRFNQAVLEAVYVKDRQRQRVEITEVFEALFSRPSSNKRAMVAHWLPRVRIGARSSCRASRHSGSRER
jgi:hypothetical protein